MPGKMLSCDGTWQRFGVTEDCIRLSAERLREPGALNHQVHRFFDEASTLVLHSWFSFPLTSIAFFHTVLGVEKSLRLRFDATPAATYSSLFARAIDERLIHDGVFLEISPLRKELTRRVRPKPPSYSHLLAQLVPLLRNQYFHGDHILADDFLPLSMRMRDIADALALKKPNTAL